MSLKNTWALVVAALLTGCSPAPPSAPAPQRLEFSRMLVHWSKYIDPGYLAFVDEAQPEVVQAGFYGVDFWALAHVPKAVKGPTAATHYADGDLKASGQYLENLNRELHKRGIKVIGHIDTTYHVTGLIDSPKGPREGFFHFYNDLWDEKELGPKPVRDPLELIQRKADGSPYSIKLDGFSPWPIYHGCLNNPDWRKVMKAFVKRGIERGVDGFVINYFYTNGCMCRHCVRGFKDHLRERYPPPELRKQFGIEDIEKHQFAEINGWYKANEMTPLRLEGLRFSDISRKKAFDDIFIAYGRSLKPGLILAQWLHSYQPLPRNDERFMLPPDLWARGEDYLWYCVGKNEPTLQMRYMRGAGGDRPFSVCHYENVKIRASMAELAANGGAPMTRYANFNDPQSRQELLRFFRFMKRYNDVYNASLMAGEAVLLYPRSQLHLGRFTDAITAFHAVGNRLLDDHVLFDVLPDDMATPQRLARYRRVFTISSLTEMGSENYSNLSRFEAPPTVRVSASNPPNGGVWDIHFVNYNRQEPAPTAKKTGLIADENPIAISGVKADLAVPPGFSVTKVDWITPESPDPSSPAIDKVSNRVRFSAPEFLVYAVARIHLAPGGPQPSATLPASPLRTASARPIPARPVAVQSDSEAACDRTACGHLH
ncbi:MAG: hypothetical protein JNN08_13655, partial [Bryobacterales bacterium]|nr:hypothetical protein [Bryobacterales bacterium]